MEILKNPNFDFLSKARYFIALSIIVIVAGVAHMYTRGLRMGVEFSGGTQLIIKFEKRPETGRIRPAVERVAPGSWVQDYDEPAKNQVLVRAPQVGGGQEGQLDATATQILQALATSYAENPIKESS